MNDEKQVLVEENEKLTSENNQFREIFSVIKDIIKYLFSKIYISLNLTRGTCGGMIWKYQKKYK